MAALTYLPSPRTVRRMLNSQMMATTKIHPGLLMVALSVLSRSGTAVTAYMSCEPMGPD